MIYEVLYAEPKMPSTYYKGLVQHIAQLQREVWYLRWHEGMSVHDALTLVGFR